MEHKKYDMYQKAGRMNDGWKRAELVADVKAEVKAEAEITVKKPVKPVPPIGDLEVTGVTPEVDEVACGYCITPGMSYTPMQKWNTTYEPEIGLSRGTIFPELDLPFLGEEACDE